MILLGLDVETTGLDKQNDRVIELGVALYSTNQRKFLDSVGQLVKCDGVPITAEITELTKIYPAAIERFGYPSDMAMDTLIDFLEQADAVVGHNINRFDWPVCLNWATRHGRELPDILRVDTMTDIPGKKGEKLVTMCANEGFINPNPHSALDDAKATVKLAMCYDIDAVIARAKVPLVVVRSHQPRGDENNKAVRKLGFRWNGEFKIWWQAVKETDVQDLANRVPFQISVLDKSVPLEQLQD